MYTSYSVAVALLSAGLMVAPHLPAASILDQSNSGQNYYSPLGPTFVQNEMTAEMAQTFTPGISGYLASISVDLLTLDYVSVTPISLELISVDSNGLPNVNSPLSTAVTEQVPPGTGLTSFDFTSQNIYLFSGQQVAYWLTADPVNGFSRWIGSSNQSYSGGEAYFRFPGATDGSPLNFTDTAADTHTDAYFQTFMNPAPAPTPEPATVALFGLGLAAIGLLRRRAS